MRLLLLTAAALVALPAVAQSPAAACVGGRATLGATTYACQGIDLLGHLPLASFGPTAPSSANEVWGWTDPQTRREIALVGLSNGVGFVDVTTPTAPVYLGKLASATAGNNLWRTFRTEGSYLFVGSEASGHGIQVFDLTRLRGVTTPQTFTQDARYTRVSNTHTLLVHDGYLYLSGNTSTVNAVNPVCTSGGLHIVDVRSPLTPTYAGCYTGDGYTHEAQCLTYAGPDTEHAGKPICFAYQGQESATAFAGDVTVVDMTNRAAPRRLGIGDYPAVGYAHQGWLTPDGRRLLINDEFDVSAQGSRTIVMDVSDLDNPSFVANSYAPAATYAHNLYVKDGYSYHSNYTSGIRIRRLASVLAGQTDEVAWFDTYPANNGYTYDGQWMNYPYFASGTVVVSDIQNGLFVLRPTTLVVAGDEAPDAAQWSLSAPTPNPATTSASLTLAVAAPETVRATVVDAAGREVAVVFEGLVADQATLTVDTRGLAAGAYVVRVVGASFSAARALSVVR